MTIDVERIAREAGAKFELVGEAGLNRFCNAILEEAAKVAETTWESTEGSSEEDSGFDHYGENSARNIL